MPLKDKDGNPISSRGRSFKNKLFDAIKEESLLELPRKDSTPKAIEKVFLAHLARRAFEEDTKESAVLLKELVNKSYPPLKAALPEFQIDVPEDATASQRANLILQAVTNGQIPPDVGQMLIGAAKTCMEIELGSDLIERLEGLENQLTKRLAEMDGD